MNQVDSLDQVARAMMERHTSDVVRGRVRLSIPLPHEPSCPDPEECQCPAGEVRMYDYEAQLTEPGRLLLTLEAPMPRPDPTGETVLDLGEGVTASVRGNGYVILKSPHRSNPVTFYLGREQVGNLVSKYPAVAP